MGKNISVRNSLKKTNEIINNNSDPMNKTKNKNELSILSIDKRSSIRNKKFNQSQNINLNVNSNLNQSHQEDSIIKKSPLIINSLEYYRNYFNLLFSSFKLNSKKQEIFENVKLNKNIIYKY